MTSSSKTQESNKQIAVVQPFNGPSEEIKKNQVRDRHPATVSVVNGNQSAYQNVRINVGPSRSSHTQNYTFERFDYSKTFDRFNNVTRPSRSSRIQHYTFVRFDYDN